MKFYRRSFLIAASVISVPLGFFLFVNLYHVRVAPTILLACILCVVWSLYWSLKKNLSYSFHVSYLLVCIFWLGLFYQTCRRLMFVVSNDSLEGPGGAGSPLAFLIGMFFEQLLFLPLSVVFVSGIVGFVNKSLSLRLFPGR